MTTADWKDVGALLLKSWTSHVAKWGRDGIQGYVEELAVGVTPEEALAALRSFPGDFPPSVGAVRRAVVILELDPPTWQDVLGAYAERRRRRAESAASGWECPYGRCDDGWVVDESTRQAARCECYEEMLAWRRGRVSGENVLLAEFLDSCPGRILEDAAGDSTASGYAERDGRRRWEEHVEDAVTSGVLARVPGDMPRIERARKDVRARRGPGRLGSGRIMALLGRGGGEDDDG